eukprot:scaffold34682_cov243-Amphora_coffeaeformis.AAC.13
MEPDTTTNSNSVAAVSATNTNNDESNLKRLTLRLQNDLKRCVPKKIDGISVEKQRELHELAPFLPKERWTELGDAVKQAERPLMAEIPGEKWISLRCDGTGFSKYLKTLRSMGVMDSGYSDAFATLMQDCCQGLLEKFNGTCGFTQSDELTVLIAPQNVSERNGVQQSHPYNGRVQKLCSLAAATVTARFNFGLLQICTKAGKPAPEDGFLATFDCRVGVYDTKEEAVSLLLWRAYDSGVNGVSDAVHQQKGKGKPIKGIMKFTTNDKLVWLYQQGLLPLPRHQREGSYYVKQKVVLHTTNRATGEPVSCLRSRVQHLTGNLIRLYQEGAMFPPHESLPEGMQQQGTSKKAKRRENRKRRRSVGSSDGKRESKPKA